VSREEVKKNKNHFPSLPARANQESGLVPIHRYGRGRDWDVILEVIGSADRLTARFTPQAKGHD
jgi:hypothetical protein